MGMGMHAVDGVRSRCVWGGRGRGADGRRFDVGSRTRDRLCCDRFPGDPGRRRLGLDRDLDLVDASVWCCLFTASSAAGCNAFPVGRGGGRGGDGGLCHTTQVEGAKTEVPSSKNEAQALVNMSLVVGGSG